MVITAVVSKDELSNLVEEFGVHFEGVEVEVSDDEELYLNEGDKNLQEVYDVLLENCGKYAVAKSAIKKMKKIEEEHKSTLVQLKDANVKLKS